MDKHRTKLLWQQLGLPTPAFRHIVGEQDLDRVGEELRYPLAVKPVHEGSSIGVSRASDREELLSAWLKAVEYDDEVLVEPWLGGPEYTIGVLGNEALPVIRLEPAVISMTTRRSTTMTRAPRITAPADSTPSGSRR